MSRARDLASNVTDLDALASDATALGALSALTITSAAWSAANTVTVTFQNNTGSTLNETTGTLYVWGR